MTHRLETPSRDNPVRNPLTATLRYRCACHNEEVLQISTVLALDAEEEVFMWQMRMMWRDMRTEIAQHTKPRPEPLPVPRFIPIA